MTPNTAVVLIFLAAFVVLCARWVVQRIVDRAHRRMMLERALKRRRLRRHDELCSIHDGRQCCCQLSSN